MLGMDKPVNLQTNAAGQLLIDLVQFPSSTKPSAAVSAEALSADSVPGHVAARPSPEQPSLSKNPKPSRVSKKDSRSLLAQWKRQPRCKDGDAQPGPFAVAEIFSPPRFRLEAEQQGLRGLSFDVKQGWDLLDPTVQREVDRMLDRAKPELLVARLPCEHTRDLNGTRLSPLERARLVREARAQARFATEQCVKQAKRGGKFMLEHPLPSSVWKYPPVQALVRKYGQSRVDVSGLKDPESQLPSSRATGLVLNAPCLKDLCRRFPGDHSLQVVEDSCCAGFRHGEVASKCTPHFVRTLLQGALGEPRECLCSFWQEDDCVECVSLSGFECLAGELPRAPENRVLGSDVAAEPMAVGHPPAKESPLDPIGLSLKKLHNNLGHPSKASFLRVLKNSGASDEALRRANDFTCPTCEASKRPSDAIPAQPAHTEGFNDRIGMDVKYFQGWAPGSKVPCLNIVDYGSSFQQVVPLSGRETGDMIRKAYAQFWLSWAGVPNTLVLDPSQPNLSQSLCQACEDEGTRVCHVPAEAHWQIGKVERHGGLLATVLNKVLAEIQPRSETEWKECLIQAVASKNSMLNMAGVSPYQFVFGRNPRIPSDLLQDSPSPIANDAVLTEPVVEAQNRIRQAARAAVVAAQDHKALREALRARPRLRRDFESGQWVAYWRSQKLEKGKIIRGFRWYGPALVLGKVGQNVVIAHRRSILRCAPEQLRPATCEEQPPPEAIDAEGRELLGMRQLLDKGKFPQNQLVDLTSESFPPSPEEQAQPLPSAHPLECAVPAEMPAGQTAGQIWETARDEAPQACAAPASSGASTQVPEPSSYAPVRARVRGKQRPSELELHRPAEFLQEDVSEMLQEVLPKLLPQDSEQVPLAPPDTQSPREPTASQEEASEVLFCQDTMVQWRLDHPRAPECEVLLAGFLQKRLQKELPATGNPEELQERIEEAKGSEWCTMLSKPAVKVHTGAEAERIKRECPHRFIGSRFVITEKVEEGDQRIKARWCLQGHLDPDFRTKVTDGACHSPTMSQLSRALLLQILASKRWRMCLGDVKGAFLEAGAIKHKYRPLYARQPPGGIPGLNPSDVIEVTGNVYGLNDAPFWWWETFDSEARAAGFERSQFDNCVYYFREPKSHELSGVLGAHVDDSITGGEGLAYEEAVRKLRARFPFRKWRIGAGEFCGVNYVQDPVTYEITYSQKEYAQHLRPISLTKARAAQRQEPASARELSALRGLNGASN